MGLEYPSLGHDGLRLLRATTIRPDFLSFQMTRFPRTSPPRYTAVSYTWGDGAPTQRIYINDQPFYVRRNLWSCLYYLSQDKNVEWTYLWVDAICIDQSNDLERAAQVRVMDAIYRDSLVVSVWLGLSPSVEQYSALYESNMMYEAEDCDFSDSIEQLANRPYWGRVWVIQEFLLGRDVNLYCGANRINWLDFKDMLGRQTGSSEYLQTTFNLSEHTSGSWAAWPLVVGRHPDRHPEAQQPLCELLVRHGNSQCKDPRDKVFALLGLVTVEERSWLERFLPDYTMSEDDVITIALSHVRCMNLEYDYGEQAGRLLLSLGVHCEKHKQRLLKRAERYDCLGDVPPSLCFELEWDEMGEDDDDDEQTNGSGESHVIGESSESMWSARAVYTCVVALSLVSILKIHHW